MIAWTLWTPGRTDTRMHNDSALFVAAFRDKGAAKRFLRRIQAGQRRCGYKLVGYSIRRMTVHDERRVF